MDILKQALLTFGLPLLLLLSIMWAMTAPAHSQAVRRYFDIQLYATAVVQVSQWLLGWESAYYTIVYDCFFLLAFAGSAGVVWEAWKRSPTS